MTTNLEARALADILTRHVTADEGGLYASHDRGMCNYDCGTLAAEARHGGRALTKALALFGGPSISRDMMAENPTKAWHYHIDPSGSYGWEDPRRGAESREAWQRIAQYGVEGKDLDWGRTLPYLTGSLTAQQAEAMLDWPIYRAAVDWASIERPQVYVNVSGGIAEAAVTRGEVDVIVRDWDNLDDDGLLDYDRDDLLAMREELARVAMPGYRARLLADMDEKIEEYDLMRAEETES